MDNLNRGGAPDSAFVPEACTLPTAEQPLRVAEFAELFALMARTVTRSSPTRLRVALRGDPAMQAAARSLAAREGQCCSFLTFTVNPIVDHNDRISAGLELTVAAPEAHIDVLDGLQRLAEMAMRHQEPV